MSSLFKALKNLGKTTQKVQNIQPPQIVNNNCQSQANMATQVILNNGIKMPRIGRKYKTLNFLILSSHYYGLPTILNLFYPNSWYIWCQGQSIVFKIIQ